MDRADKMLKRGIVAFKEGRIGEARGLLADATRLNPSSWKAWLWLSRATEDEYTRRDYLEKALEINPGNSVVQTELEELGGPRAEAEEMPTEPVAIMTQTLAAQRRQAQMLETLAGQQEVLLQSVNTIRSAAVVWLLLVGIGILASCILVATGGALLQ